jgi:hypothetical protein
LVRYGDWYTVGIGIAMGIGIGIGIAYIGIGIGIRIGTGVDTPPWKGSTDINPGLGVRNEKNVLAKAVELGGPDVLFF